VLVEAVMDVRIAQRQAAQAGAAQITAERLRTARRMYTTPPASHARATAPGDHTRRDFPFPIQQVLAEPSTNASTPKPTAASRPSRGPALRQQRGPIR
jgi:hypothetical protein